MNYETPKSNSPSLLHFNIFETREGSLSQRICFYDLHFLRSLNILFSSIKDVINYSLFALIIQQDTLDKQD